MICQLGFCQLITDFQQLDDHESFHCISATLAFPHACLCSSYSDNNKPKERSSLKHLHQGGSKPISITVISHGCGKFRPLVASGLIDPSSPLGGDEGLCLFWNPPTLSLFLSTSSPMIITLPRGRHLVTTHSNKAYTEILVQTNLSDHRRLRLFPCTMQTKNPKWMKMAPLPMSSAVLQCRPTSRLPCQSTFDEVSPSAQPHRPLPPPLPCRFHWPCLMRSLLCSGGLMRWRGANLQSDHWQHGDCCWPPEHRCFLLLFFFFGSHFPFPQKQPSSWLFVIPSAVWLFSFVITLCTKLLHSSPECKVKTWMGGIVPSFYRLMGHTLHVTHPLQPLLVTLSGPASPARSLCRVCLCLSQSDTLLSPELRILRDLLHAATVLSRVSLFLTNQDMQ